MTQAFAVHELSSSWTCRKTDDAAEEAWLPVARVPTNIHLDLIDNKVIPDPYLGFNELRCEWVAEKSWTYRTNLPAVVPPKDGVVTVLTFDGLDTFATVKLNGKVILTSDNMFVPHQVDVTRVLHYEQANVLEIDFASALIRAREIKDAHPEHKWVGFNGDMARLAVRKAQYHWGWGLGSNTHDLRTMETHTPGNVPSARV